jgi:hypothetical protein
LVAQGNWVGLDDVEGVVDGGAVRRFNRNASRGVWWRRKLALPSLRLLHALQHPRVPSRAPRFGRHCERPLVRIRQYSSLPTDSRSLLRTCLPTTSFDVASRTCKNLARGVLTIMQRYVKDSGISIKTHFAGASKRPLQLPPLLRCPPRRPLQLEDQTSLWNFCNIAQGHWVALVPLIDQNDLRPNMLSFKAYDSVSV